MSKPVLFVVGMHRSGTSLAMQALETLGVDFGGALLAGDKFNPNGYFEAPEIIAFHDDLLSDLGRAWGRPEHGFPIPHSWFEEEDCLAPIKTATSLLGDRLGRIGSDRTLAIKDPRATLFLPIWIKAAEALGLEPRVVICIRHPAEVAASLDKRDKLDPALSELYWLTYIASALYHSKGLRRERLLLSKWATNPTASLQTLARLLPAQGDAVGEPVFEIRASERSYDPNETNAYLDLWWKAVSDQKSSEDDIDRLAGLHINASHSFQGAARAIRAELGETTPYLLDRDLQNYRKQLAELTKKYDADQSWISEQSAALEEQSNQIDQLAQSLSAKEEELADYEKDKLSAADLQNAITALTQDRDAQAERAKELLAAYQTSEGQIADLQAALGTVEQERDTQAERARELLAAYQEAENRMEGLQNGLTQTTADRDAQAERAKELLTAYQETENRLEGLQTSLTQITADRDAQAERARELLAAYQTSETSIQNLQTALAESVEERGRQAARALELLEAYQTAEERIVDLEACLAETATERDVHSDRAKELLAALQAERDANELLRERLRKLNPLNWFQAQAHHPR